MDRSLKWKLRKNKEYEVPTGPEPPPDAVKKEVLYLGDCVHPGCEFRVSHEIRNVVRGSMAGHGFETGHRRFAFVENRISPVTLDLETGELEDFRLRR